MSQQYLVPPYTAMLHPWQLLAELPNIWPGPDRGKGLLLLLHPPTVCRLVPLGTAPVDAENTLNLPRYLWM